MGLLAVAGCATQNTTQTAGIPEPIWPELPPAPPVPGSASAQASKSPSAEPALTKVKAAQDTAPPSMDTIRKGPVPFAYARRSWARGAPDVSHMDPMLPPKWITVHHEGWTPFYETSEAETKARLEQVRNGHLARDWGDIGYHFVVDRAGRVWEGRYLKYQGAHVRKNNENNVGVMCLGNFMEQEPSAAQVAGLQKTIVALRSYYRIPMGRVRTHREWPGAHTECPGSKLQARVAVIRRSDSAA